MRLKEDINKNEWFDKRLLEVLGNEYKRHESSNYVNTKTDIDIIHIPCGRIFSAKPYNLLQGYGCASCSGKLKKNTESFKKEVFDLVGDEYEVISEYEDTNKKIQFKHNDHTCWITPHNFLQGRRCGECSKNKKKTTKDVQLFLDKAYPTEYKVIGEYINKDTPIDIIHNSCGTLCKFTWNNIRSGKFSCNKCKCSNGELQVKHILENLNINYEVQYKFNECKDKKCLPFDFYFKFNNIEYIIEYDGRQHFMPIFGKNDNDREKQYQITINHDNIKNEFCKNKNIKLLRIKYSDNNISDLIKKFISE